VVLFVCGQPRPSFLTPLREKRKEKYMLNDNKKMVYVQEIPKIQLLPYDIVTVERQGDRHTWMTWTKRKTLCHIVTLPGRKYKLKSTGEVFDMLPKGMEKSSSQTIQKTFEKLRGLIRTNFTSGGQNQVMVTLTYDRFETNPWTAYDDFEDFWRRLKKYKPLKGHKLDYINVLEPQASGRWHFHTMIKSDQPELWIDKWDIKKLWRQGNAYIERLRSDDVGAYYVAYFTHLSRESTVSYPSIEKAYELLEQENMLHDDKTNDKDRMKLLSKAKIKGARLKYYPKDTKIYRCSRGVLRPEKETMMYIDFLESNPGHEVYSKATEIAGEEEKLLNRVQKSYYKKPDGEYLKKTEVPE
jgi:hypothetical protein